MARLSLEFRTPSFRLSEYLREKAQTILEAGLAPHRDRLHRVVVRFGDQNGPKGGPDDKTCSITVEVPGHGPVFVEARAHSPRAALLGALGRIRTVLGRQAARQRVFAPGVA